MLPQSGLEVTRSLNDPYIIFVIRGPLKLPQSEMAKLQMTSDYLCDQDLWDPSLGPSANKSSLSLEPILLEEMVCTLSWISM